MPELLDGSNGFILGEEEFFDRVKWIAEHPEWLFEARMAAIETIAVNRDITEIRSRVCHLITAVHQKRRWWPRAWKSARFEEKRSQEERRRSR